MLLAVIVTLLVLGVAFYQAVQGWYSALIMTILTICCALVAFNYYEPLAQSLLYARQPAYADAISLIALFVLPLLTLRFLYDHFLGSNVLTGAWPDRIGGGILGLITAQIVVGVLMVAVQMLPWGTTILGFEAYDSSLHRKTGLFPYPDEFTIGMVSLVSGSKAPTDSSGANGSMSTDPRRPFTQAHDDLLLELFCGRNTGVERKPDGTDKPLDGNIETMPNPPGGMKHFKVTGVFTPPEHPAWGDDPPDYPLAKPENPGRIVIVRCQLLKASAAQDKDGNVRLPATQFRLVALNKSNKDVHSYYPVAYLTYLDPADKATSQIARNRKDTTAWLVIGAEKDKEGRAQIANLTVYRQWDQYDDDKKPLTIDWVYRIPSEEWPWAAIFRRVAVDDELPAIKNNELPPKDHALSRQWQ
ncbi:MAG: CvpA family protein [Phycisphaerae bacterium]